MAVKNGKKTKKSKNEVNDSVKEEIKKTSSKTESRRGKKLINDITDITAKKTVKKSTKAVAEEKIKKEEVKEKATKRGRKPNIVKEEKTVKNANIASEKKSDKADKQKDKKLNAKKSKKQLILENKDADFSIELPLLSLEKSTDEINILNDEDNSEVNGEKSLKKLARKRKKSAVSRNEIVNYLNELFADLKISDYSYNGLQFEGASMVSKIVAGVDANNIFFIEAAERGAQMAVVHHGLFWKGAEWTKLDRLNIETAKTLMETNLNLYAMHLPLDAHPEFGNNVMLAKAIGAKVIGTFGSGKGPDIGCIAQLPKAIKIETLLDIIEKNIGKINVHMPFGRSKVKNIGICSGGGGSYVNSQSVYDGEIDVLLTGEALHQQVAPCRQREIHIIAAGHYNTEIFGVKELVRIVAEHFGIEYEFIDLPTGL